MTPNGCPLCGTPDHSCGQPFTGTPVDLPRTENAMGGPVQRYRVNVNGTDTVLKLNSEDAKRYKDAVPVGGAAAADETADDATDDATNAGTDEKAVTAANKSRTATNKGARGGGARNN